MKYAFVCAECRSESIDFEAGATWNFKEQRWDMGEVVDCMAHCNDCRLTQTIKQEERP